jgi:hypothetical protein
MDFALILSALSKHERMAQAAVNFARENGKGVLFVDAMSVLDEAIRAKRHVEKMRDLRRSKVKLTGGLITREELDRARFDKVHKDLSDMAEDDDVKS